MGGFDSSNNGNDLPEDEYDALYGSKIEGRITKVLDRTIFEFLTTERRFIGAMVIEAGAFSDIQFTGKESGGFVHEGKFRCDESGLLQVGRLKVEYGLSDEEIDAVILKITPEGAYVVWGEVEEHISRMHKNGGDA